MWIKTKVQQKQPSGGTLDIGESKYIVDRVMGINLIILWDRFYIFQSFLWSLTLSTVYTCYGSALYFLYQDCYKVNQDCTMILPIVRNSVRPEELKSYMVYMAAAEILFQFLITNFFPCFYLVNTIDKMRPKK